MAYNFLLLNQRESGLLISVPLQFKKDIQGSDFKALRFLVRELSATICFITDWLHGGTKAWETAVKCCFLYLIINLEANYVFSSIYLKSCLRHIQFLQASLCVSSLSAEPLKIAYSDWSCYLAWQVAIDKGWFKDAGIGVKIFKVGNLAGVGCLVDSCRV